MILHRSTKAHAVRLIPLLAIGIVWSSVFAANPYISLKAKTVWPFYKDDKNTVVMIPGQDTIAGKNCYKVEWHPDNTTSVFQTEYWFERNDSVFCAGMKAFGSKIPYATPCLVIAKTTKPGDTWKSVFGSGPFSDTVTFKVEQPDSVQAGNKKFPALAISRISRGATSERWFAIGRGIVREESVQKIGAASSVNFGNKATAH